MIRTLYILLLVFSTSFTFSCASISAEKKVTFPIKSFVKVEQMAYEKICEPEDPNDMKSDCYKLMNGAQGSGAIVGTSLNGSYILTAGHICNRNNDPLMDDLFNSEGNSSRIIINRFYVYDIDEFKYNAEILKFNMKHDACIVHVWGLFGKSLKISSSGPKVGEQVYNMAAPAGFSSKRMVPLFTGYYSGKYKKYAAIYTLPAIGGSSGSPIFNINSELVGLVYARHIRFHHIILSPRWKNLKHFILQSIKEHTEKQASEHNLPKDKKIRIRFIK